MSVSQLSSETCGNPYEFIKACNTQEQVGYQQVCAATKENEAEVEPRECLQRNMVQNHRA